MVGKEFYLGGGVGPSGPPSVRQQLEVRYSLTYLAGSMYMLAGMRENVFSFTLCTQGQRGWGGGTEGSWANQAHSVTAANLTCRLLYPLCTLARAAWPR